jgi:hypothetical protein
MRLIDPAHNATAWVHNGLDRLVTVPNCANGARILVCDAIGNLVQKTDPSCAGNRSGTE